jgi:curved DNA-binding protein
MDYKDYYKALGVDKNATADQIKKAYRKLAREFHPDKNPGDAKAEARFKEANEANEVLSDPEKRKKYDQLGADYARYQQMGGRPGQRPGGPGGFDWSQYTTQQQQRRPGGNPFGGMGPDPDDEGFGGGGFSDFFSSIFGGMGGGGGARQRQPAKGRDYRANIQLPLQEAALGGPRVINLGPEAGGSIRLTLKPGLRDGQTLRLKGRGAPAPGEGLPAGDLLLAFQLIDDPQYRLEGDDLHTDCAVSVYRLLLGGDETIATLGGGKVRVKIKPETQPGAVLRVRGKGYPRYGHEGEAGDLYVHLQAELPQHLTEKEKELLQQLAELRGLK